MSFELVAATGDGEGSRTIRSRDGDEDEDSLVSKSILKENINKYTSCLDLTGDLRQTLHLPNYATFEEISNAVERMVVPEDTVEMFNRHIMTNYALSRDGYRYSHMTNRLSHSLTILHMISNIERMSMALRVRIFALVWNEAYDSTREIEILYKTMEDRLVPPSERLQQTMRVIDEDWKKVKGMSRDMSNRIDFVIDEAKKALGLSANDSFEPNNFFSQVLDMMETSSSDDLKELSARMRQYISLHKRNKEKQHGIRVT